MSVNRKVTVPVGRSRSTGLLSSVDEGHEAVADAPAIVLVLGEPLVEMALLDADLARPQETERNGQAEADPVSVERGSPEEQEDAEVHGIAHDPEGAARDQLGPRARLGEDG